MIGKENGVIFIKSDVWLVTGLIAYTNFECLCMS